MGKLYVIFCLHDYRSNLMMPFFNRTGLECVGVVGPDLDCCWAGLQALTSLSFAKTRRRVGGDFACGRSDA